MDGVYEPIAIEDLGDGRLRGYSDVLGLYVCWEDGRLRFFDPVETYLYSHEEEGTGRTAAESRAEQERAERMAAEARANIAQNRAETAEARAAELESELRRMRGE